MFFVAIFFDRPGSSQVKAMQKIEPGAAGATARNLGRRRRESRA